MGQRTIRLVPTKGKKNVQSLGCLERGRELPCQLPGERSEHCIVSDLHNHCAHLNRDRVHSALGHTDDTHAVLRADHDLRTGVLLRMGGTDSGRPHTGSLDAGPVQRVRPAQFHPVAVQLCLRVVSPSLDTVGSVLLSVSPAHRRWLRSFGISTAAY